MSETNPPPRRVRPWIAVAAGFGILVLIYLADVLLTSGEVPRGTVVAGIDVGGMANDDAEALLRERIGSRSGSPIEFQAGDVRGELVVAPEVRDVDWPATRDRIDDSPLNPITRLTSFFTTREVEVVPAVDTPALTAAVEGLRGQTDRPTVEGGVVFDGAEPVGLYPVAGQALDVAGAVEALRESWVGVVDLPVTVVPIAVEASAIDDALSRYARPAVAGDVVVSGRNDASAVLRPDQVGAVLSFVPQDGVLVPQYTIDAAIGILAPQLAATEVRPVDARFTLQSGAPAVVPSVTGDMIDWPRTLDPLPELLGTERTVAAIYGPVEPGLTTDAANNLGIREVIGQFTTGGFEYASGVNIRKVASVVTGALVKPGETFSLNGFTGPRGLAQGYVESGIIDHGRPAKAVGGGISQFATTLYNATYFAGLEDAGHTEHSYYISRYPEAREATVFEGAIDLAFRNNTTHGVLIEATASNSDVTVRIWGTKEVDVESVTGERYAPTTPQTITLPAGDDCVPSSGAPGFTTSNTRIIRDRVTGAETSRQTRTVKYDAIPIVRCV